MTPWSWAEMLIGASLDSGTNAYRCASILVLGLQESGTSVGANELWKARKRQWERLFLDSGRYHEDDRRALQDWGRTGRGYQTFSYEAHPAGPTCCDLAPSHPLAYCWLAVGAS